MSVFIRQCRRHSRSLHPERRRDRDPMAVPAGKLESVLGVTDVKILRGHNHLAVVDSALAV